jgi:uncharacterized protein YqhQ
MPDRSPGNPRPTIGGQAVIEGVMMRGPSCLAVAVRRPQGAIVVRDQPWRSVWERLRFLRWPLLRGAVVLVESIANGMSALAYSARIAAGEERDSGSGVRDPGSGSAPPEPRAPSPESRTPSFAWILIPTLIVAVAVFKGVPHLLALLLDPLFGGRGVSGYPFHVVDGVVKFLLFVGYLLLISRMKDIQRVFAYHGAEHKAIAAFEAGEELTVAHARGKPRLHPRCGTAFLLFVILVGVLLYMLVLPLLPPLAAAGWLNQTLLILLKIVLLFPIAGLAYEAIRLSGRHARHPLVRALAWPGLALQRLVTREPTDDQIEIALASLATALARETAAAAARGGAEVSLPAERETVFADFAAFRAATAGDRR